MKPLERQFEKDFCPHCKWHEAGYSVRCWKQYPEESYIFKTDYSPCYLSDWEDCLHNKTAPCPHQTEHNSNGDLYEYRWTCPAHGELKHVFCSKKDWKGCDHKDKIEKPKLVKEWQWIYEFRNRPREFMMTSDFYTSAEEVRDDHSTMQVMSVVIGPYLPSERVRK